MRRSGLFTHALAAIAAGGLVFALTPAGASEHGHKHGAAAEDSPSTKAFKEAHALMMQGMDIT